MKSDSRNWDARYGWDLLQEAGPDFQDYVAITSPRAWAAVESYFPQPPRHLEFHRGMEASYLEDLLDRVPSAPYLLAIGGGNALDVGRYVAWGKGAKLVLIPTIVSTGSIFQDAGVVRDQGRFKWILDMGAPEALLLDYGVIQAAPPHLNSSGMAECICFLSQISAWRWWANQSDGEALEIPAWDPEIADETHRWVQSNARTYRDDLGREGRPGEEAIRTAAEVNRERYGLRLHGLGLGMSLDHLFVVSFEWLHGREILHGEGVALGTLIACYVYGWGFQEARSWLDACTTRYRPTEIGCSWEEVRQVLQEIPRASEQLLPNHNYFQRHPIGSPTFETLQAAIDT